MRRTITGPVLGEIIEIECGEDMCDDCCHMDTVEETGRMHCTIFGGRMRTATDNYFRLKDCKAHSVAVKVTSVEEVG